MPSMDPGPKFAAFHDGSIHPAHSVELMVRPAPRVKQAGVFQQANRLFHHRQRGNTGHQQTMALGQRGFDAGGLVNGHGAASRAPVNEENRS